MVQDMAVASAKMEHAFVSKSHDDHEHRKKVPEAAPGVIVGGTWRTRTLCQSRFAWVEQEGRADR
jgi:hypothetical protein